MASDEGRAGTFDESRGDLKTHSLLAHYPEANHIGPGEYNLFGDQKGKQKREGESAATTTCYVVLVLLVLQQVGHTTTRSKDHQLSSPRGTYGIWMVEYIH